MPVATPQTAVVTVQKPVATMQMSFSRVQRAAAKVAMRVCGMAVVAGALMSPSLIPQASAQVAFFDSPTDTIQLIGDTTLGAEFTIEARVLRTGSDTPDGLIFSERTFGSEEKMLFSRISGTGGVASAGVCDAGFVGSGGTPLGQWQHIVFMRSAGGYYLFLNGVLRDQRPSLCPPTDSSAGSMSVGAMIDSASSSIKQSFVGYYDWIRVSSGARYPIGGFSIPSCEPWIDANTLILMKFNDAPGTTHPLVEGTSVNGATTAAGFSTATAPTFGPLPAALVPQHPCQSEPFVTGSLTTRYSSYGPTYQPYQLVVDDAGQLLASANDNSIGNWILNAVPRGGGVPVPFVNSPIFDPDGITIDRTGSISGTPGTVLVAATEQNQTGGVIVGVRNDGSTFDVIPRSATISNPQSLDVDSLGRLYVVADGNDTVVRYTGTTPQVIATSFSGEEPGFVVVDDADNFWVSFSNGAIRKYIAPNLPLATFQGTGAYPGIAFNRGGMHPVGIYALDSVTNILYRFNHLTHAIEQVGGNFQSGTFGLTFDRDGSFYAAETNSGTVWKFTAASEIFNHTGNANPSTEGWTTFVSGSGAVSAITQDAVQGIDAWSTGATTGTGNAFHYADLSPCERSRSTRGWSLMAQVRTAGSATPSSSTFLEFSSGERRYQLLFGNDGTNTIIRTRDGLGTPANPNLPGSDYIVPGTGYHQVHVTFNPTTNAATVRVDGVELTSTWTGFAQVSAQARVLWGSGQPSFPAEGRFALVSFAVPTQIDDEEGCCDSIDFNGNGVFPEDQDVVDYLNVLAGGVCESCDDIDFNNNGVFPEDQDVIDFFSVLAGGTCN